MMFFVLFMTHPMIFVRRSFFKKGTTLLEALIYMGLSTFIIAGTLVSVYPIFMGTERLSAKAVEDTELAFLVGKFSWMLSLSAPLVSPSVGAASSILCLGTLCDSTAPFKLQGDTDGRVFVFESGSAGIPITSPRVKITDLMFERFPGVGGLPDTISFECSIGGRSYGPIYRYVGK
jgi:hypothetical protein